MELKLLETKDENTHNEFAQDSLLQRWEWGDFKKMGGWEAQRVAVLKQEGIVWSVQVLIKKLPFGLTLAYAPYFKIPPKEIFSFFTKEVKKHLAKINAICFIAEPAENKNLNDFGYTKSFFSLQPQNTLVLDLSGTEEELLSQMKQKGRYNIRLAQKKEVLVKEAVSEDDFKDYKTINEETAKRDRISARPYSYLKQLFLFLEDNKLGTAFLAYYHKKPVAGAIISIVDKKATYMYGASSNTYRNVMAPYLVQWEAIKYVKNKGCTSYDFFGISPEGVKNHGWSGITRFKKQFGGKEVDFSGTQDIVLKPFWYLVLKIVMKIRKVSL